LLLLVCGLRGKGNIRIKENVLCLDKSTTTTPTRTFNGKRGVYTLRERKRKRTRGRGGEKKRKKRAPFLSRNNAKRKGLVISKKTTKKRKEKRKEKYGRGGGMLWLRKKL